MKTTASASVLLAFAASVNAHLFISSPPPIPGSAPKDPLDANGDNFPCHGVALPGANGMQMPVGSSQLLAFDTGNGANTAVHGGGSCQISLTYETDPAKIKDPANWHVLYSIMGGCPTNSPMNLNGEFMGMDGKDYTGSYPCTDPNTNGYDCVNQFNFTIPPGVQNGQATLAWTWFNNVGNREIYMNCVAVDITGGENDASKMSQFPEMFVANLASINNGQCATTEQIAVDFPNPGAYTTTKKFSTKIPISTAKDYPLSVPSNCGAVDKATAPANTDAAAPTSAATTAVPQKAGGPGPNTLVTSTSAPALATPSPLAGGNGSGATPSPVAGGNGSAATPSPATGGEGSAATPAPVGGGSATTAGSAGSAATGSAGSASQGSCDTGSVSCTTPGNLVCMDTTHFGICDSNNCAVTQDVADGTVCVNNAITYAGTGMRRRHIPQYTHVARYAS